VSAPSLSPPPPLPVPRLVGHYLPGWAGGSGPPALRWIGPRGACACSRASVASGALDASSDSTGTGSRRLIRPSFTGFWIWNCASLLLATTGSVSVHSSSDGGCLFRSSVGSVRAEFKCFNYVVASLLTALQISYSFPQKVLL